MAEAGNHVEGANQAKRRRIPKSCTACRYSKLGCDKLTPCTRCSNAGIECTYLERPEDPNAEKIQQLEIQVAHLHQQLYSVSSAQSISPVATTHSIASIETDSELARSSSRPKRPSRSFGSLSGFDIRHYGTANVVEAGAVLEHDAITWFSAFFEGCDRFVPVFDLGDIFATVRERSSILFDIIIIYGARAVGGSNAYQNLYSILRQHTSDLVLRLSDFSNRNVSIEDIQAILVIASYSTSGAILCDIAIRAAIRVGLPSTLDAALGSIVEPGLLQRSSPDLTAARVWCYIFVLDVILSLDGGKPLSITLQSPRRIKSLLKHPQRTPLDIRLFAQVELNALRSSSYASLLNAVMGTTTQISIGDIVRGCILDLDLWLSEWQDIVLRDTSINSDHDTLTLNLRVQHAWAVLTLHLRALATLGIDNIALMTETQRNIASAAKTAAEQHLRLVLTPNASSIDASSDMVPERPYIDNFAYAMEFVWAKNAFCVLIALRLGILLADPLDHIQARLTEANDFLYSLDKVGLGMDISYTRILRKTVQKCERTIQASLERQNFEDMLESSGTDFESFVPKQFVFEWDFPGLRLCYSPLDWRDLFQDIDGVV